MRLRHRSSAATPDWTDYTGSDPGVTFLQVLTFVAEALAVVALVVVWRSRRRRSRATSWR